VFAQVKQGVVAIVRTPQQLDAAFKGVDMAKKDLLEPVTVLGTGFVVDELGIILTASHVVAPFIKAANRHAQGLGPAPAALRVLVTRLATTPPSHPPPLGVPPGAKSLGVQFGFAPVVGIQDAAPKLDIAALLVKFPQSLKMRTLELADEPCEEGDEVAACGFPFGRDLHKDQLLGAVVKASFSQGIVSATLPFAGAPREARVIFQLDAMINSGNSGGPVFDPATGKVLGVIIEGTLVKRVRGAIPGPQGKAPAASNPVPSAPDNPGQPPAASPPGAPAAQPQGPQADPAVQREDPNEDPNKEDQLGMPTGLCRAVHIHSTLPLIEEVRRRILKASP
jgi:hypothetical protein